MKYTSIIIILSAIFLISSCCHTRKTTKVAEAAVVEEAVVVTEEPLVENPVFLGTNLGYVSHQFRLTGCKSVIAIPTNEDTSYIIPVPELEESLDIDGQYYHFNYRPLKIKNPDGCMTGIPAEVYDISPLMK